MSAPTPKSRVFRLPVLTYIVVVFMVFGAIPLAFTADGTDSASARLGLQTLIILVPIVAGVFVARTATVVDAEGLTVRAVLGRRRVSWDEVHGLSITGRSVYAVLNGGSIRLPCVRVSNLAEVARVSAGRLPEIADPTPKYAPSRRRRG